ncbi:DUF294 nucleotidyltransferase-like domain-containing protein [Primorskyibacter marinus]|uniref:DUF294 nucleotidyltransferase-like domain-containing protein n=1 Tax=Primorskyibacter marinus TaxID=1977320 RepID=UPI000E2FFFEE|nr:DUF294 nucleotidyltransferase-like domain-containing protein [Primorskyibacter marinus]
MTLTPDELKRFLDGIHPYDTLPAPRLEAILPEIRQETASVGTSIYELGDDLQGLYIIHQGEVEIQDANGVQVSLLGPRNSFGERGLLRGGVAVTQARAVTDSLLLVLPRDVLVQLIDDSDTAARFFNRKGPVRPRRHDLATTMVDTLMARQPVTCPPTATVQDVARQMRKAHTSSVCVTDASKLTGIVTSRDLAEKVVAEGLPATTPVAQVMTPDPVTLSPSSIGSDVLHMMLERRIGHVPVTEAGLLVGIVTQTDLTRFQAISSAELVAEVSSAEDAARMAEITARIPRLLVQLVAGGNRHEVVTRLITDIADTATRRLLTLAEQAIGPAPVPYLWLACGSQGRQEQTGVSDQDNCLIIDDAVTEAQMAYFHDLAQFVCDGLNTCGYVYCPGDMMANNPRWCQPLKVWQGYFQGWINRPDPEAQMLASVMFDLRPIGGTTSLFDGLQTETLKAASDNSIFVAHMVTNSLKHAPPLGLLRGFATIRSGEHKNHVDLKHNGVVPVVDLGRIYALRGQLTQVNTRARLASAIAAGVLSASGGQDLLDAYDLIAERRLAHQAARVRGGSAPNNYLSPSDLSDFERSHLRNAFVVVKTMQSAIGHGRGMLG